MDYMTIKEASKVGQEKLEELGAGHEGHEGNVRHVDHEGHVDHSNMVADFKKRFIITQQKTSTSTLPCLQ